MEIRTARPEDAAALSAMLQALVAAGKRTNPADEAHALDGYIAARHGIRCTLAVAEGRVLGLQALFRAEAGNYYGTPEGWGMIGTHVAPDAGRRGIGRALFAVTEAAARQAGLGPIEASIAEDNAEGLAYYEAMGFRTHRRGAGRICKRYDVGRAAA